MSNSTEPYSARLKPCGTLESPHQTLRSLIKPRELIWNLVRPDSKLSPFWQIQTYEYDYFDRSTTLSRLQCASHEIPCELEANAQHLDEAIAHAKRKAGLSLRVSVCFFIGASHGRIYGRPQAFYDGFVGFIRGSRRVVCSVCRCSRVFG